MTVFADDPVLADAWATRLCNDLRPGDLSALGLLDGAGVGGACVILGDHRVSWGKVPPVVRARVDRALISAGGPL